MDPITLTLQIIDKSLSILLMVIQDQPAEERRKAWVKWFEFWDSIKALNPPVVGPTPVIPAGPVVGATGKVK